MDNNEEYKKDELTPALEAAPEEKPSDVPPSDGPEKEKKPEEGKGEKKEKKDYHHIMRTV